MATQTNELFKHKTKSDYYITHGRRKWEDLYPSIRYFLEKNNFDGESFLEIGCAAGGLYEIFTDRGQKVRFTGLDISPAEIRHARRTYPRAAFLAADFMKHPFKAAAFDTVTAFQVVSHQKDYKKFISKMVRLARRRVIFDVSLRYDGTTVTDLDFSYLYYHGSGRRNHYVVFNVYELLNYLHHSELGLKKISVYGYYAPQKTSSFVPFAKSKLVIGAFCLEKRPPGEKADRWGGRPEFAERPWCELDVKLPDLNPGDL